MRTAWTVSHTLFTTIGGIVGWFLGGTDGFLLALVTLVAIDYATGVIAAFATGELSSSVGFKGIARKVMIFALVGLANILDVHVLGEGGVLRTTTIFFYLANEGMSIVENAARIGLPVPDKLRDALATITQHPARGRHVYDGPLATDHVDDPPAIPPRNSDTPESIQPPRSSAGGFLVPNNTSKETP